MNRARSKKPKQSRDMSVSRTSSSGRGKRSFAKKSSRKNTPQKQREDTYTKRKSATFSQGEQVEGRQAVRELLLAGKRAVKEVLLSEGLNPSEILSDIENLSHELGVPLRKISRQQLSKNALTTSHQGVLARARPLPLVDLEDLIADPKAFLLVLDGVTDPQNLGSILRIAECSGVTGVVLPLHRSVKITPTVTKTAAGAVEHVPLCFVGGVPTSLSEMTKAEVRTIGLDASGEQNIFETKDFENGPIALVLGKEGAGLSRLTRERVDALVSIPLSGQLNSLNVAIAGSVACFEVVRRRKAMDRERE